jgi:hypothetical protein
METIDVVLQPEYVAGLTEMPIAEVRRRRNAADEVETGMSYLRRLLQGRQDIVRAELQRRAAGEAPGDLADLVRRLPEILSDNVHAPGLGRLSTLIAPGEMSQTLLVRLDAIVSAGQLADLPHVSDADLHELAGELKAYEEEVSVTRHSLHAVLDRLKEEIVRRYRTGEADIDDLFRT